MQVISGHLGWVRSIAFDPGNEWFCTGSADRTIKVIASAIMVSTSQVQCVHTVFLFYFMRPLLSLFWKQVCFLFYLNDLPLFLLWSVQILSISFSETCWHVITTLITYIRSRLEIFRSGIVVLGNWSWHWLAILSKFEVCIPIYINKFLCLLYLGKKWQVVENVYSVLCYQLLCWSKWVWCTNRSCSEHSTSLFVLSRWWQTSKMLGSWIQ